jgi:class 3 adenylate cyclase
MPTRGFTQSWRVSTDATLRAMALGSRSLLIGTRRRVARRRATAGCPGFSHSEPASDRITVVELLPKLPVLLRPPAATRRSPSAPERVLATVLFTDLVGSTATAVELGPRWAALLREHNARIRRVLARFAGRAIDTAGDGFFASGFDRPARAIECAFAIRDCVSELGLRVRIGIHTGECELIDGKPGGLAVVIGARVAAQAEAGEVLVSRTVTDLVAGSGIEFEARGLRDLKGLGEWPVYAVTSA